MIWKDVWLEVLNGPQLGESYGFLVVKHDVEALWGVDGGLVRRSEYFAARSNVRGQAW